MLAGAAYLAGVHAWVYRDRIVPGIMAVCLIFPMFIHLTGSLNASILRILPLIGVGMFLHRYGFAVLHQIKLLWFTTLNLATVVTYYYVLAMVWS